MSEQLLGGWVNVSLFDICSPKQWQTISTKQLTQSGYPVYGANGKIGFYSAYNHEEETILITCRGATCGVLNISEPKSYVNGNAMALDDLNQSYVLLDYLFYTLLDRGTKDAISGTAQPQITKAGLEVVSLPLAPFNEQKRIVAKIEALQARSRAAREALADVPKLVEQFKKSVLAAAFRGDLTKSWRAVHGRTNVAGGQEPGTTEQNPNVEPAEQLLERIRIERRQKWEANQLAAYEAKGKTPPKNWQSKYKEPASVDSTSLPESWTKASLNELISFVTSGSRGWAKYYSAEGSLFLRVGNLDRQTISLDLTEVQRVSPPHSAEGTRTRVQSGDLLISITADLGMVAVIDNSLEEAFVNQHISLARPVLPMMRDYLGWFVANPSAQNDLGVLGKGIGKSGLGLDDIRELKVPIPTAPEQHQITQRIKSLLSYADSILKQAKVSLKELDRLDQSILAKAFRGELVPQDPTDEPASVLLERIKAERAAAAPVKRSRKKVLA